MLVLLSVLITFSLYFYFRQEKQYFEYFFSLYGNSPERKSTTDICHKHLTLRDYCLVILQCKDKNITYISTDISILHEIVYNSTQRRVVSHKNSSYLQSDAFLKFKAFHQSAHSLSVHLLDDFIYVVRIPTLDSFESPNNDPNFSYIFSVPTIHWTQRSISPFKHFGNLTYYVGKASSYLTAFFIITNAIAHSSDGNVLVQTCSRAITVSGCGISNTTAWLQSKFSLKINTSICTKNLINSDTTIISVNKLVVIAHTWYNAYYHLSMEAMSRLMMLHELILFDPDIYILLQYPIYQHSAKELFNLFGIAQNRIIYYDSGMEESTLFRANIMFVPRGVNCGGPPPSLLEQIRFKALNPSKSGIIPLKPYLSLPLPIVRLGSKNISISMQASFRMKSGPIILISRPKTGARHLQNEMDIVNFLSREYEMIPLVIFYGNISLVDSINLFHSARVVVAPHGAGQVHMLWMRPGTAMIEIAPLSSYFGLFPAIATYRQIQISICFDVMATSVSSLKVDMTIFTELFKEIMQERY
jgi:hypothetical protein